MLVLSVHECASLVVRPRGSVTDCSTILGQDQTEILDILFGSNLRTAFPHSQAVAAVSGSVSETLGVPELRSTIYILLRGAT